MIPVELLRQVRRLHFKTRRQVSDLLAGQYESAFKGRGMEFAEVREYQVGDDIRTIDWNVSARLGRPLVKTFQEERELTVILLLDLSGSHLFGTREKFKSEVLGEVAGLLAFLAIRTNDRVGAILFSSGVEKYIPPKKGASHVWRLIREIFVYSPRDRATNIDGALAYLNRVLKRRAVVFLISDCVGVGFGRTLRLTAKRHDLTVIRLSDPAEEEIPAVGLVHFKDPETGEIALVNTGGKRLRREWKAHRQEETDRLQHLVKGAGVEMVELSTAGPVVEPLLRLFERRSKRL